MSKVILTRGIQGSGKSTWAKAWVAEDPTHRARWNGDDVRNMMGPYWVLEREKTNVLDVLQTAFIKRYMSVGWDIVIDNMNLNPKTVEKIAAIVSFTNKELNTNYTIECKDFFDISVNECIERDKYREHPIGEKVIKETYRKYRTSILQYQCAKFVNKINKQDSSLPKLIIFDLDGTVAYNTQGRPFYGEGCASKIYLDYCDDRIVELINIYKSSDVKIGFLTGREDTPEIREATEEWLINHVGIDYKFLLMRPKGSYISGPECKLHLYNKYIKNNYNVLAVYEDSESVCKMWRNEGLLCLQPNNGKC